jgi:hypothetical protein
LELVEQQITRTQLLAPFDGLVIKGDLKEQLGAPVKRGESLLTLSPSKDFRVVLEVPERDIGLVVNQQAGEIALTALPDRSFAFRVERIIPMAVAQQGRSFFEVESKIQGSAESLRPGMEGLARVSVGDKNLAWILGHRLFDWIRLSLWSLGA